MGSGEAPVKYLSGIVILENGMESEFALREDAVKRIQQEMGQRRGHGHIKCDLRPYNLADGLVRGAIIPYLHRLIADKEKPRQ